MSLYHGKKYKMTLNIKSEKGKTLYCRVRIPTVELWMWLFYKKKKTFKYNF